jgi:GH43 family beta-xylosidase
MKNKKKKWTMKGKRVLFHKASRLEWEIFCAWVGITIPYSQ